MEVKIDKMTGKLEVLQNHHPCEYAGFYADYIGNPTCEFEKYLDELQSDYICEDFTKWFHGPFLMMLYDKKYKTIFVAQHLFGTPVPVYFAQNNEAIFISTTLKKCKEYVRRSAKLNEAMLPHYFYNGFLPFQHTLIQGIYKLPPRKNLLICNGDVKLMDMKIDFFTVDWDHVSEEDGFCRYQDTLRQSVNYSLQANEGEAAYAMALSSGYDSNCILYNARQLRKDREISCYSVGGDKGIDETVQAEYIAGQYENVSFRKATVTPETLTHLDEIVERLEGTIYERGIFLQYELSHLLKEDGRNSIICGECADQIFHQHTYGDKRSVPFVYSYGEDPFEMAYYVVLKKSTYMLQSFGVEGYYPFLEREMLQLGYETRFLNQKTKKYYKSCCKRFFPLKVSEKIGKSGGSTSLEALFEADFDCLKASEKSRFFDDEYRLTQKYGVKESIRDYYLSLCYLESFEKQFCD